MSKTQRYNPETHEKEVERRYIQRKVKDQKEINRPRYEPIENAYMANDGMIGDMEPDGGYGN